MNFKIKDMYYLYIINYYTSLKIVEYLKNVGIGCTGTMKKRFKGLNEEMKSIK